MGACGLIPGHDLLSSSHYMQITRSKTIRLVGSYGVERRSDDFLLDLVPLHRHALKEGSVDLFFQLLLPVWCDRYPLQDGRDVGVASSGLDRAERLKDAQEKVRYSEPFVSVA